MFTDYTPMFAFEKVKWYETLHFNMVLAVGCLLVFLSIIPVVLVRLIRSRRLGRDRKVTPRGARIAQWVIAATCAASLAFVLGTVLWGDAALVPLFGVSPAFRIVLGIGVVAAVLTAGAVIYAVLAWKNGYWNTAARIYYTVVTVGAVAFIWFLNSWNLLGWRF